MEQRIGGCDYVKIDRKSAVDFLVISVKISCLDFTNLLIVYIASPAS